jgi:drug/metabolite transporter (DMT)-like permease
MAIGLALVAAALYGSGDFLGGLANRATPLLSVLLISQGVGLIGMLIVAALIGGIATGSDLALGALAGIAGVAGVGMLYRGLASGAMSTVAPITGVVAVVVPVAVGIGGGERPAAPQYIGIALAVAAVTLLSAGGSAAVRLRRDTLLLALGAGLALGLFYVAMAKTSTAANLWPLASARGASVTGLVLVAAFTRQTPRFGATRPAVVLSAGVCDVSANALYLLAVHHGLLSIVAVLASLYPVPTVLWSMLFLGERLRTQQIVGVGTAIAAVVLITVG